MRPTGPRGWVYVPVLTIVVMLAAGCNLNPFFLGEAGDGGAGGNGDGGGGGIIDGGVDDDGGGNTPDADNSDVDAGCVPQAEVCDSEDNDCDGAVDEETNTAEDPSNCGGCGIRCALPGALGTCSNSTCSFVCSPAAVDINGDLNTAGSDGCEYGCLPTNGGVEACDLTDNDCDDRIDEDFGVDSDINNCGGCGNVCNILNAVEECTAGQCGFSACEELVVGEQAFADIFDTVPGCEYQCPVSPPVAETCNNIDDDCDGVIDDDASGGILGTDCTNPGFETQADVGECVFGSFVCSSGSEVCAGYVGPQSETCNNLDDDCDGQTDENFDNDNDPNNCGTSCTVCDIPNAIEGCSAGACTIAACITGFFDLDPAIPGCEYECTPTGPEVCDGRDNDCDGLVDGDDDQGPTLFVGAPANFCNQLGECSGVTPVCAASACDTTVTFRCPFAGDTEADNCFVLPLQESNCDGLDGDCDGFVDEAFITLGDACDDGEVGACRGVGQLECTADATGTECIFSDPGLTPAAQEFNCDNIDEDCDGLVDEGAPDSVIGIDTNADSTPDFFIDAYEASRPDATLDSPGAAEHRACSTPGVLPWSSLSWAEADAACTAAGKRLCTEVEWELACAGTAGNVYPYGDTYDPNGCNGNDFDQDCGVGADADELLTTGFTYGCPTPLASCEQTEWAALAVNDSGTFDMSGNLKEWTDTQVGTGSRRIRGGTFDSAEQGMTCQFDFVSASEDFFFPNLGFRCCSN